MWKAAFKTAIYKTVIWVAQQIKWLVSIWHATLGWSKLDAIAFTPSLLLNNIRLIQYYIHHILHFNPSRLNPGRWEKITENFYFPTSLWCLKEVWKQKFNLIFISVQLPEMHGTLKVNVGYPWLPGLNGFLWKTSKHLSSAKSLLTFFLSLLLLISSFSVFLGPTKRKRGNYY